MLGIIIALISGALMSIQGVFNTGVTKQTSMWVTNSVVQFSGLIVCVLVWFFKERKDASFVDVFKIDNKYMLLGGVIGAFITYTVVKSMDSLGPAKAVLIIVVAQIFVAYLIELFGLFQVEKVNFQWSKLVGIIIAVVGIVIFKW